MNVCYNIFVMKKIIILFGFLIMFAQSVIANPVEVVVLPISIVSSFENYYSFENVDEIASNDVINYFNKSLKIHSPNLYELNSKINNSQNLKNHVTNATDTFKSTGEIDYDSLKFIAKEFDANSVLLIYNFVTPKKENTKRDIYEVLDVNSSFDVQASNELKTEAVLINTNNDLVLWSATYRNILSDKLNHFKADTIPQAFEQLEKIKLYSKDILSKNIAQNVTLRFYPKVVRAVDVKTTGDEMNSGVLRFDKDIPSINTLIKKSTEVNTDDNTDQGFDENKYGELILGL